MDKKPRIDLVIDWHKHKAKTTVNKNKSAMHARYADWLSELELELEDAKAEIDRLQRDLTQCQDESPY